MSMKLVRKALGYLPRFVRHRLIRELVTFNPTPPARLTIKLAETKEEMEKAFQLLHDAYVEVGFMKPDPSGMRVTLYHALPSTSTIIALIDGEVVGTLSLIRENPLGLPLEKIFNTTHLKKRHEKVTEVSSLAVRKEFRKDRGEILFPLLKYMYQYCTKYFGVDHLLIAVNPAHIDFYEAILFFERISSQTVGKYDFVNGAPAVGAVLDLARAWERFSAFYGSRSWDKDLFEFITGYRFRNLIFPDRPFHTISDPIMTPELLNYFFNEKTELFSRLTTKERTILCSVYPDSASREVILKHSGQKTTLRKVGHRYETRCRGMLFHREEKEVHGTISNISTDGFHLATDEGGVDFNKAYNVRVWLGRKRLAKLVAQPVWTDCEGSYGFKIQESCPLWRTAMKRISNKM